MTKHEEDGRQVVASPKKCEDGDESTLSYGIRRWGVLASFGLSAGLNGFLYMNFSSVTSISMYIFSTSAENVNWLYSTGLIAGIPVTLPIMYIVSTHFTAAMVLLVFFNAAGAGIRYWAVLEANFPLAVVSSIFIGIATTLMFCTYTVLGERWFPPKQRALAISLGVQSNYLGWCIGAKSVPEWVVSEKSEMESLQLYQFIFSLLLFIPVAMFVRDGPSAAASAGLKSGVSKDLDENGMMKQKKTNGMRNSKKNEEDVVSKASATIDEWDRSTIVSSPIKEETISTHEEDGVNNNNNNPVIDNPFSALKGLFTNWRFCLFGACYSIIAGVSFTIPAVQDSAFTDLGFTSQQSSWTNVSFILVGVIAGIILGFVFPETHFFSPHVALQRKARRQFAIVLTILFAVCSLSLTSLTLLSYASRDAWFPYSDEALFSLLIVSMGFAGASSLGFIGIALTHLVLITVPISEAYSGGMVELVLQAISAVLAVVAAEGRHAFTILLVLCLIATFCLVGVFAGDYVLFNRKVKRDEKVGGKSGKGMYPENSTSLRQNTRRSSMASSVGMTPRAASVVSWGR